MTTMRINPLHLRFTLIGLLLLTAGHASAVSAQGDMDEFNGCPLEGDARQADNKRLNQQKNRYDIPGPRTRYRRIRLQDVVFPGPDKDRFPAGIAAEMVGFVREVKFGSRETCNCHETRDKQLMDTHIDLVPGPGLTENNPRRAVVVEVTPRLRELMRASGQDWSTVTLKREIEKKWVRVRGWLFYDHEHTRNAAATNPGGDHIYKGGNWEIHPITEIKLVSAPVEKENRKRFPTITTIRPTLGPEDEDFPLDADAAVLNPNVNEPIRRPRARRRRVTSRRR